MYIGRFAICGKTPAGVPYLGYRVSSRSFPNRRIVVRGESAVVLPTLDAPPSDNPYISYNCLRAHAGTVVVGNGTQVDPIIEKVAAGYPLRDAIAQALLALDYEHDQLNTPRVVAGIESRSDKSYLGIVTEDKLVVRRVEVAAGQAFLVATYERTEPTPIALAGETAEELCRAIYDCEYEKPVAAVAAVVGEQKVSIAVK